MELADLVDALRPPRHVWVMVPAGAATRFVVEELARELDADDLVIEGGIDARLMSDPAAIEEEIRTKVTICKENGGYIFHSDHSIPPNIPMKTYEYVLDLFWDHCNY